jgi:FkbM family methyltransferase
VLALLRRAPVALGGSDVRQLANQFLSPQYGGPKYLLGRNEHSAALLQRVEIDGIIDDYFAERSWHGHPVVKCNDVPKNAIVANCSMSISPISAFRRLQELGVPGCIYYADLYRERPELVPVPFFVADTQEDISAHEGHWISLFERLADRPSKNTLSDLLGYRLSADPRHMAGYSVRFADQYFEDFLHLEKEVFVDAGGFDGDTTKEFCKRYPDYQRVILFEPSAKNMHDAKSRLMDLRNVEFVEKGLSNAIGSLWFDPDAGSASAVTAGGTCSIDVTTLDAALSEKVSFIKMDLEGWELKALEGARGHILADHPKLAISVYHAACDFWQIPEYIATLRDDYDIFLRHYTEGWSETVMFFVPR